MSLLERPSIFERNVRRPTRSSSAAIIATENQSDATLLQLYVENRSERALEILCNRYSPLVLSVCANLLSDSHDIEDASQSVFLILTSKASSIRNRQCLAAWLHRVARAEAIQIHRNKKRRQASEFSELNDTGTSPAEQGESIVSVEEQMALLHDELNQLPEKYRGPIILCFLQGKSRLEAAEALGATDASVKASLMRGRELLRKRLLKRGIALTSVLAIWEGAQASAATWGQQVAAQAVTQCLAQGPPSATFTSSLSAEFSKLMSTQVALSCAVVLSLTSLGGWFLFSQYADSSRSTVLGSTLSNSPEQILQAEQSLDQFATTLDQLNLLQFHIERDTYEVGGSFPKETWRYRHIGEFYTRDGWWRHRYKFIGNGYQWELYPVFGASEQILNQKGYSQFSHGFAVSDELMTPESHPEGELARI
ncbi:MAG: sigma-70 family RNA polymerase sigma factor [Planctomycetaceae bacterium]|nr:sigma-70 family RNA polymerase sigma factor [Planctomycetaceae bacterium]